MTPNNIVNMAMLKGLDVVALTDHNSCKNCASFLKVAARAGILALPGMEINTAEEVHAVCLFKDLDAALAFDEFVYASLPDIKNDPDVFGEQTLRGENDEVVGSVEKLLIAASGISFFELGALMAQYGGFYFPAHIDRDSFSLLSNLGFVPPEVSLAAYELADISKRDAVVEQNPVLAPLPVLTNSDAHYLWDISEPQNVLDETVKSKLL